MIVPIEGYAPDIDPTTPGILTNCSSFVPSLKGFEGAPAPLSLGISSLAAACQGGSVLRKLDDSLRLFAATGTALYELSGTSWTDRTRAVGGAYALGTDLRWSFAQFGNVSLAACKTDTLQASTTAAFSNVSGAPKSTIVETVGQFVFAMDYNDGTDVPHGWYCCAKGDYTDWTPSIANECATGVLTSAAGPIKAGKRFGDAIIAYKLRAMYIGVYVGVPAIWDFREIPGEAGALGQYAVVDIGTPEDPKHIFMGEDDFYQFDGSRPLRIGAPVKETVYSELNRSYAHLSIALHDRDNSRVYFYYCSSSNVTPDKCVVYNYRTNKWGRDDRTIEFAMQYSGSGITYDSLGSSYSTYDSMPSLAYDSSFFTAASLTPAVFDTSHVLKTLNAPNVTSSLTTGDYGDDQIFSTFARLRPRFITKPSAATMTNYYRNNLGDSLTTDVATAMDANARFDLMREARWHRVRIEFTGPVELPALSADFIPGGAE